MSVEDLDKAEKDLISTMELLEVSLRTQIFLR